MSTSSRLQIFQAWRHWRPPNKSLQLTLATKRPTSDELLRYTGEKQEKTMEYRAKSVEELFQAMVGIVQEFDNSEMWWRGQLRSDWSLRPSLYHQGKEAAEKNMNIRFMNTAPVRHANCPAKNDPSGWLFLMQHYGLPTRLLDWSKNILIASYFAVDNAKEDQNDAAIWGLNPTTLNQIQLGTKRILVVGGGKADKLVHQAFLSIPENERDNRIAAIHPDHRDIRHLIQASMFTVHGTPTPMNEIDASMPAIRKILIPKDSKERFRQSLFLLGITRSYIYPDLQNLSSELAGITFSM